MDVADFDTQIYQFHQSFRSLEKVLESRTDRAPKIRHSLVNIGIETCAALGMFFDNYLIIYRDWVLSEVRFNAGDLQGIQNDSFDAFYLISSKRQYFFVSFKAVLFFLRLYQDGIYRCLNNSTSGSMSGISNDRNPVRQIFSRELPTYYEWFSGFRVKRDHVKFGRSCSMAGPRDNLGVIFNEVTDQNGVVVDLRTAFHLSDIIKAIQMSIEVTKVAQRNLAQEPTSP